MSSVAAMSTIITVTTIASTALPAATASVLEQPSDDVPAHHANPVVAFIIGLAIITLASIMNAAGLNLTKLDHVRTSAIPKEQRRRDWLRPLWLLGMILYILSQLIGSTLALEYMRAEYVAPLGSTSLIFNFLFAKFLVNSPVTSHDIYGTIIVIIGVIGIVAFGSINSGFATETDAKHLTYLWTRGNWLLFFFAMAFSLILVSIFTSQLDAVLAARADLDAAPFASIDIRTVGAAPKAGMFGRIVAIWEVNMLRVRRWLESWTAAHDDKRVAWTLGIGWACLGGGLAGGCLVFAKATVKLTSGALSHENTGNQFGHASSIFTFILLAVTAVSQIICLNRGLKVYDSTLVVPVFYGVYTAAGFLNSLIFNDEVDAYQSWTLFLIFCSILTLVSGVVLLTNKKPDQRPHDPTAPPLDDDDNTPMSALTPRSKRRSQRKANLDEEAGLQEDEGNVREDSALWQLGEVSDDEDAPPSALPSSRTPYSASHSPKRGTGVGVKGGKGERAHMMSDLDHEEDEDPRASTSSDATLTRPEAEEFAAWSDVKPSK